MRASRRSRRARLRPRRRPRIPPACEDRPCRCAKARMVVGDHDGGGHDTSMLSEAAASLSVRLSTHFRTVTRAHTILDRAESGQTACRFRLRAPSRLLRLRPRARAPCSARGRPDGVRSACAAGPSGSGACAGGRRAGRPRRSSGSRCRAGAASDSSSHALSDGRPSTRATNASSAALGQAQQQLEGAEILVGGDRPGDGVERARAPRAGCGRARIPMRGRPTPTRVPGAASTSSRASARASSSRSVATRNAARSRRDADRYARRAASSSPGDRGADVLVPRGACGRPRAVPRSCARGSSPKAAIRRRSPARRARSCSRSSSRSPGEPKLRCRDGMAP